jgi:hypothetical protein
MITTTTTTTTTTIQKNLSHLQHTQRQQLVLPPLRLSSCMRSRPKASNLELHHNTPPTSACTHYLLLFADAPPEKSPPALLLLLLKSSGPTPESWRENTAMLLVFSAADARGDEGLREAVTLALACKVGDQGAPLPSPHLQKLST